jgi:hypothetical protein
LGKAGAAVTAPFVKFIGPGKSPYFVEDRYRWRRMRPREEARLRTGFANDNRELHVGVFVERRQNKHAIVGFNMFKVGLALRPEVLVELLLKWQREDAPSLMPKSFRLKSRFSKSFVEIPTTSNRVEFWKQLFESVLTDSRSYENDRPIE